MKRKVFSLFLQCFFSLLCVAQIPGGIAIDAELHKPTEVIDSADYRFIYLLRCIVDTAHMDDPLIQKLTLKVGKTPRQMAGLLLLRKDWEPLLSIKTIRGR